MKISIKDAALTDLNRINELLRLSKAHWGYDEQFLTKFMTKFGITHDYMKTHIIKLFYVDDELAGFFNFGINSENQFELDNFFLHPSFIGRGIGRQLWEACCQVAAEQGHDEFILWGDPHAESFYLKMGCKKIGARQSPMLENRFPSILRFKLHKK